MFPALGTLTNGLTVNEAVLVPPAATTTFRADPPDTVNPLGATYVTVYVPAATTVSTCGGASGMGTDMGACPPTSVRCNVADPLVADGFQVVIESADAVLAAMSSLVERAARKTAGEEADGRHAFVIVHPFEHLAIEVLAPLIGAQLGPVDLPEPLDALWIAWHPNELTVWSKGMSRWTQVIFTAKNEYEEQDGEEPLQAAERLFLDRLPGDVRSPFSYRLDDRKLLGDQ